MTVTFKLGYITHDQVPADLGIESEFKAKKERSPLFGSTQNTINIAYVFFEIVKSDKDTWDKVKIEFVNDFNDVHAAAQLDVFKSKKFKHLKNLTMPQLGPESFGEFGLDHPKASFIEGIFLTSMVKALITVKANEAWQKQVKIAVMTKDDKTGKVTKEEVLRPRLLIDEESFMNTLEAAVVAKDKNVRITEKTRDGYYKDLGISEEMREVYFKKWQQKFEEEQKAGKHSPKPAADKLPERQFRRRADSEKMKMPERHRSRTASHRLDSVSQSRTNVTNAGSEDGYAGLRMPAFTEGVDPRDLNPDNEPSVSSVASRVEAVEERIRKDSVTDPADANAAAAANRGRGKSMLSKVGDCNIM